MARYRSKSEQDMQWNRIRRTITREIDLQIMNVREELLNDALTGAWEEFTEALSSGKKIELESDVKQFVGAILRKEVVLEVSGGSDR